MGSVASAGVADAVVKTSVPCSPTAPGGGPAGLIASINQANAHGGGTINLAPGCTYSLGPHAYSDSNGLPVVRTPITINGSGSTIGRSQAPGTTDFRIFEINGPGNLTLSSVTVTGGRTLSGGGILNDKGATLTLNSSRVDHNAAISLPGGRAFGGGIANDDSATVIISNSRVDHNSAGNGATVAGGGGLYENNGSRSTLNASRVDHNVVTAPDVAQGGGIGVDGGSGSRTVVLNSSQVDSNVATATASGPKVVAKGGGIGNNGTTFTLNSSRVTGNTVSAAGGRASGGGILNLTIKDGGAFPDGLLILTGSQVNNNVVSGNPAGGGGISNQLGIVKSTSSQVTGNTSSALGTNGADGGGIENILLPNKGAPLPSLIMTATQLRDDTVSAGTRPACGGGLFNSGTATLSFSTVTGNRVSGLPAHGGGLFNSHAVSLASSLVAGNVPDNRFDGPIVGNCSS